MDERERDLRELERVVERGFQRYTADYVEVGLALAHADAKLYLDSAPTFELYARHRFGIAKQTVSDWTRGADVAAELRSLGEPTVPTTRSPALPVRLKRSPSPLAQDR